MITSGIIFILMIVSLVIALLGIVAALIAILLMNTGRARSYDRAAKKMAQAVEEAEEAEDAAE